MITPAQAEDLARIYMMDYINQGDCANEQDIANMTLKLMSVCSVALCAALGRKVAVELVSFMAQNIENNPVYNDCSMNLIPK